VYVPAPTSIDVPVDPLLQATVPAQPEAVSVAFSVPHTCDLLAATVGADGRVPVVIVTEFDAALVPQVVVQVAVYVPAPTSIDVPVDPLLQATVPAQPEAVSVAFSVPHTCDLLVATVGADGVPPLLIVTGAEAVLVAQTVIQVAV
jgi:hypothetical protein